FDEDVEPRSEEYNYTVAFRLRGELQQSALRVALELLAARHAVLRGSFGPQLTQPVVDTVFSDLDLSELDQTERDREVRRQALALAREPFVLSQAAVLRAHLLRLAEREHVLVLALRPTVVGGCSLIVPARELRELYDATLRGETPGLPALAVPSSDDNTHDVEQRLALWCEWLDDLEPLALATDHPRAAVSTSHSASVGFHLDSELSARLKELADSCGATLNQTLLSALFVLVRRYTGQTDLAICTPTSET